MEKEIFANGVMAAGKVGTLPATIPKLASGLSRTYWARHRRRLRKN